MTQMLAIGVSQRTGGGGGMEDLGGWAYGYTEPKAPVPNLVPTATSQDRKTSVYSQFVIHLLPPESKATSDDMMVDVGWLESAEHRKWLEESLAHRQHPDDFFLIKPQVVGVPILRRDAYTLPELLAVRKHLLTDAATFQLKISDYVRALISSAIAQDRSSRDLRFLRVFAALSELSRELEARVQSPVSAQQWLTSTMLRDRRPAPEQIAQQLAHEAKNGKLDDSTKLALLLTVAEDLVTQSICTHVGGKRQKRVSACMAHASLKAARAAKSKRSTDSVDQYIVFGFDPRAPRTLFPTFPLSHSASQPKQSADGKKWSAVVDPAAPRSASVIAFAAPPENGGRARRSAGSEEFDVLAAWHALPAVEYDPDQGELVYREHDTHLCVRLRVARLMQDVALRLKRCAQTIAFQSLATAAATKQTSTAPSATPSASATPSDPPSIAAVSASSALSLASVSSETKTRDVKQLDDAKQPVDGDVKQHHDGDVRREAMEELARQVDAAIATVEGDDAAKREDDGDVGRLKLAQMAVSFGVGGHLLARLFPESFAGGCWTPSIAAELIASSHELFAFVGLNLLQYAFHVATTNPNLDTVVAAHLARLPTDAVGLPAVCASESCNHPAVQSIYGAFEKSRRACQAAYRAATAHSLPSERRLVRGPAEDAVKVGGKIAALTPKERIALAHMLDPVDTVDIYNTDSSRRHNGPRRWSSSNEKEEDEETRHCRDIVQSKRDSHLDMRELRWRVWKQNQCIDTTHLVGCRVANSIDAYRHFDDKRTLVANLAKALAAWNRAKKHLRFWSDRVRSFVHPSAPQPPHSEDSKTAPPSTSSNGDSKNTPSTQQTTGGDNAPSTHQSGGEENTPVRAAKSNGKARSQSQCTTRGARRLRRQKRYIEQGKVCQTAEEAAKHHQAAVQAEEKARQDVTFAQEVLNGFFTDLAKQQDEKQAGTDGIPSNVDAKQKAHNSVETEPCTWCGKLAPCGAKSRAKKRGPPNKKKQTIRSSSKKSNPTKPTPTPTHTPTPLGATSAPASSDAKPATAKKSKPKKPKAAKKTSKAQASSATTSSASASSSSTDSSGSAAPPMDQNSGAKATRVKATRVKKAPALRGVPLSGGVKLCRDCWFLAAPKATDKTCATVGKDTTDEKDAKKEVVALPPVPAAVHEGTLPIWSKSEAAKNLLRPWMRPEIMVRPHPNVQFADIEVWTRQNFFTAEGGAERLMREYNETLQGQEMDLTGNSQYSVAARDRPPCTHCAGCATDGVCRMFWFPAYLSIHSCMYEGTPDKLVVVFFPGWPLHKVNQQNEWNLLRRLIAKDPTLLNDLNLRVYRWQDIASLAGNIGRIRRKPALASSTAVVPS